MNWADDIDPATIPDEVILSERGKRNRAKVKTNSGPSKTWRCQHCLRELEGKTALRAHIRGAHPTVSLHASLRNAHFLTVRSEIEKREVYRDS